MKQVKPTSIRIDEELYDRIRVEAEKEKRSVSAHIEYIIEKYYEIVDNLTKK